jgi:hypothetical protein
VLLMPTQGAGGTTGGDEVTVVGEPAARGDDRDIMGGDGVR